MTLRALVPVGTLCAAVAWSAAHGAAAQSTKTVVGLEVTVRGVARATSVSLRDCPPGENTVRGVIRPGEDNEFATVTIDVKVLPTFQATTLAKPALYDAAGTRYNTAQAFAELNSSPAYTCEFAFRVPKGTTVARLAIGDASFDLPSQ